MLILYMLMIFHCTLVAFLKWLFDELDMHKVPIQKVTNASSLGRYGILNISYESLSGGRI